MGQHNIVYHHELGHPRVDWNGSSPTYLGETYSEKQVKEALDTSPKILEKIEELGLELQYESKTDDEVYELLMGRKFNRTKGINIDKYNFSHVLVDPPRSGLTKKTIEMVGNFKNIIYISCNPETYLRDINFLKKHKIKKIELFDQFPNTQHLEIVSLLQKN